MLARRRPAKDSEIDDDTMEKAMAFLKERLEPEEMTKLKVILKGEKAEEAEDDEPTELPKPGGKLVASDARPKSYSERWPTAARIRVGY